MSNTAKDLADDVRLRIFESGLIGLFLCLIAGILISCGVAWERNYQHRVLERARFIEKERNEMLESELYKKLIAKVDAIIDEKKFGKSFKEN